MLITSFKNTYSRSKLYFGLIAAAALFAGLFLSYVQPGKIDTDGGIFSAVAFKDTHGGKLYADTWENKPPGIFYLIELFYFLIPSPVYALFVMSLLFMTGLGAMLFYLFYRYFESFILALLFTGIAVFFIVHPGNIHDGLYTEIYGTCFLIGSLCFHEYYRKNKTGLSLAFSGIFLGLAPWFKEPFILICLPVLIWFALFIRDWKSILKLLAFALAPALLFFAVLAATGSFQPFIETILYNFGYTTGQAKSSSAEKLDDYYRNLFQPIFGISCLALILLFKNLNDPKTRKDALAILFIFISSASFVFLSPYNFGHYYFASFVLYFVFIAKQYDLLRSTGQSFFIAFFIGVIYYVFHLSEVHRPRFTFRIVPYTPDRIAERLINEKDATLFVDYVNAGRYYALTGKVHPAFLPVGLPIHFNKSEKGKQNLERIWKELSGKKPDYLITTHSTSYFSWHLPESKFYEDNYQRIDSIFPPDEYGIYLWKKKQQP